MCCGNQNLYPTEKDAELSLDDIGPPIPNVQTQPADVEPSDFANRIALVLKKKSVKDKPKTEAKPAVPNASRPTLKVSHFSYTHLNF